MGKKTITFFSILRINLKYLFKFIHIQIESNYLITYNLQTTYKQLTNNLQTTYKQLTICLFSPK